MSSPNSDTAAKPTPAASSPPAACSKVPGVCRVCVQPLGTLPPAHIELVREAIESTYGVETHVLTATPLPAHAWYAPRKRHRADVILDFLADRKPSDCDKVVALTTKDISVTKGEHKDWGILGLGSLDRGVCVVSSFRVRRKLADTPPEERHARVAIHELGHAMGLGHCPNADCFMRDAGGTVETLDDEHQLCGRCRRELDWHGDPPPRRD